MKQACKTLDKLLSAIKSPECHYPDHNGIGYMKSDNNIVNSANVRLNADGTFTVHFGWKTAWVSAKDGTC